MYVWRRLQGVLRSLGEGTEGILFRLRCLLRTVVRLRRVELAAVRPQQQQQQQQRKKQQQEQQQQQQTRPVMAELPLSAVCFLSWNQIRMGISDTLRLLSQLDRSAVRIAWSWGGLGDAGRACA